MTILHHLLSSASTIERSREVILEYTLSREIKLREKKPGRGGKGTLDKEGLEDIGERLAEVEAGLTNAVDLALILSLRMSLSYFTLPALARQLLVLSTPDAERVLVQHIRRRVEGTGRYGVGMELESLEALVSLHRSELTRLQTDPLCDRHSDQLGQRQACQKSPSLCRFPRRRNQPASSLSNPPLHGNW